jgi:hypothetical protein
MKGAIAIPTRFDSLHFNDFLPRSISNTKETATMSAITNPRKSLSDQLDRLDGILDGLAEAIPDAVALAVRQSLQEALAVAVKQAVTEALLAIHQAASVGAQPTPDDRRIAPDSSSVHTASQTATDDHRGRRPSRLVRWSVAFSAKLEALRRTTKTLATQVANRIRTESSRIVRWRKPILIGLGSAVVLPLLGAWMGSLTTKLLFGACIFGLCLSLAVQFRNRNASTV